MKRTLTAVVFAAVMVACFCWKEAYLIVFSLLAVSMSVEFYRLVIPSGKFLRERICVILSEVMLFVLVTLFRTSAPSLIFLAVFPVIVAFVFMLFDCCEKYDFEAALFFPLLYVALPLVSTNWIVFDGDGVFNGIPLLLIFVIIWMNDIGAYLIGMGFGQKPDSRKLFPALSPKKSWAGLYGGVAFSFASAFAVWKIFPGCYPLVHWMAIALIVSVLGISGDLFESLLKRHASVKDSGNILPGHGGSLDRFDAALLILPAVAAYLRIFAVI